MSLLEPPRPALDPALEKQRVELADLILRHTPEDGSFNTGVEALFVSRYSQPSDFAPSLPKPALCIMAQGRKEVRLADEYFAYDPLNYLVVSVSMPISGRVVEISPERPVLALRLAVLEPWVHQLPKGLDTCLGTDGISISNGQRHRLGLARAILQNRPIVLLDEPTAGLDEETEQQVLAALSAFCRHRTMILVSHRPAVMAWADHQIELICAKEEHK